MQEKLFQCDECKLHFEDEQLSEDCRQFCKEYKACNLEILKQSIEHKKMLEKTADS